MSVASSNNVGSRKLFNSPPLPFNGNKRNWINCIKEQFKDYQVSEDTVFVDLFGGSGLLSHLFAWLYPNNKVIYNDYDRYVEILDKEVIEKINTITQWGRELMAEKGIEKGGKISMEDKEIILNKFKEVLGENWEENEKLKNIICVNFCFSGRNNFNGYLYNKLTKNEYLKDFKISDYILDNIVVEHKDYKVLLNDLIDLDLKPEKYIFILDPPYLSTSKSFYAGERNKKQQNPEQNEGKELYWGITKTCDILDICLKYKTLLFESDRSEIFPLIKIIEKYSTTSFNYKLSEQRKLGAHSNSNDYYILFNFDDLEIKMGDLKKALLKKNSETKEEKTKEEKMKEFLKLKEELGV